MQNFENSQNYSSLLQKVTHFIDTHLEENLNIEMLSRVAGFSRFHLHRQFTAYYGLSIHRYIQLARLKRAAYQLAFREKSSVLEIALDSGYESAEAFARAFKQRVGQTPSEFRKQPDWASWRTVYKPFREARRLFVTDKTLERVGIEEFTETRVAVLEHRGAPHLLGDSIRRFIAWRKQSGIRPPQSSTFNILYDDPEDTPENEFRLDLCASVEHEVGPNDAGILMKTIPGGRCAVLRHTGIEETLGQSITYLYRDWLPQSGEQLRDFPLFLQRIRFFPDVAEHEAVVDLFMPLQ